MEATDNLTAIVPARRPPKPLSLAIRQTEALSRQQQLAKVLEKAMGETEAKKDSRR